MIGCINIAVEHTFWACLLLFFPMFLIDSPVFKNVKENKIITMKFVSDICRAVTVYHVSIFD